ncbi:MAG: hypothetical protein KDD60_08985, partial [Bdellovibrionales bacterium]|nr:hypothetical protein [Bdellovibrionales bacterium]
MNAKNSLLFTSLLASLALVIWPLQCAAQIIRTGSLTYQSSNEESKIIVVPSTEKFSGIFFLHGDKQPLQLFDPSTSRYRHVSSCFFRYDSGRKKFTTLLVGEEEFNIHGSLTVILGNGEYPRISLNQAGAVPYISVAISEGEGESSKFSVLSFLGVLEVVNISGPTANL